MNFKVSLALACAAAVAIAMAGCIRVHIDPIEVAPISIYAKLDADVRLKLDDDVKAVAQKYPGLFEE
jgi:hypothetical protein